MREKSINSLICAGFLGNTWQAPGALLFGSPPAPQAAPTPPRLSLLLPDLSDLESAFLHFIFLPVRTETEQNKETGHKGLDKSQQGNCRCPGLWSPRRGHTY